MFSVLILGLLLGLQHAVESDHLAAVASLGAHGGRLRDAARLGAAWGVGHSLTLLLFGGAMILIGGSIGPRLALGLESLVGFMLILLGSDVLLRLWRKRVHFHAHNHGRQTHFHAHSHTPGQDHADRAHRHNHSSRLPLRPLLVGMVHGMAGSAALIVLALGSVQSVWQGFTYLVLFGIGSAVGMAALAVVISLPLRWSAHSLTWAHNGLTAMLGVFTVTLGALLLQQSTQGLL